MTAHKRTGPNHQPAVHAAAPAGMAPPIDTLLRLPAVLKIIPVSRSKFYQEIKKGNFPAPQKIGTRISVWRLSIINQLAQTVAI
jgi:prophage regulatory protein